MNDITRREFNKKIGIGLSGIAALNSGVLNAAEKISKFAEQKTKPNILFICSDQHSFNYTGFSGHPKIKTPNLDQLAKNGTVFSDAYSGQPVCVPGRASLMTGMFASDVGSYCNTTVWDGSKPIWGKYFRDAGYHTRASGKLDLDDSIDTGFNEVLTTHGHKSNPDITSLFRQPLCYRVGERPQVDGSSRAGYHTDDYAITKNAIGFIENESKDLNKPWALYLGYQQPHPKFIANEKYYNQYLKDVGLPDVTNEELEDMHLVYQELRHFKRVANPIDIERMKRARAAYYGMITELDELIGKVITSLKESNQFKNTIIVYTSDHGESLGDHGLWYKNNLYDCSVRIPLIISGPGIPEDRVEKIPVAQVDLVPTLLEFAKIENPNYLRGESLTRFFKKENNDKNENVVYAESHSEGNCTGSFMIRKGDWKYIYFTNYEDLLFNLKHDPKERNNLANIEKYKSKKEELNKELMKKVNPDKITSDAFKKQKSYLDKMVAENDEDGLFDIFKSRLGNGQARTLSQRLKGKF